MKKIQLFVLGISLFSLAIGVYFFPQLPDKMASHWNSKGEVDGYLSKFWGTFFMPLVIFGLGLLFLVIPKIDPLRENIEKFRKYYEGLIILLLLFMFSIYLHGILWNLGTKISPNIFLPFGLGILFFYVGILCEHAQRNWFIGIRTPWTLSSEKVWNKTHQLGAKLFKIAAIIVLLGMFFPKYSLYFILVPVLSVAASTIIYSYLEYRKERQSDD